MNIKSSMKRLTFCLTVAGISSAAVVESAFSRDVEWSGFGEEVVHHRKDIGISKARSGFQLEGLKFIGDVGPFSNVSVNGIMRISYDAVYDLNDDEYGDKAGGAAFLNSYGLANIGAPTIVPVNGSGLGPAGGLGVGNFAAINILGPRVEEITGAPAGTFSGPTGMLA